MECNCNNNNSNGGVIPWVRGNRLPLIICVFENVVTQEQVGDSTLTVNEMTRVPYTIQDNDTVTVIMKSGFRQVEMPFTTDGNKVMVTDNGELPTGAYTVEVTIERGDGARGRWQETRQVRIYENTSDAQLGEMYSIDADLFFYAKGDTGTGIADITSNPDDTLTITMTDGTTYTTQSMKGDKGDKGDQGEKGTSIVSFDVTGQTDTSVIYTVTFSDDTTEEVAVPKGPQGDTGLTGNGIASTTLNSDYTLTIAYTDGTTYTTPSIRGAQGVQGVSIIAFTQTGETATNTLYNVVFSDGRTQSVAIPKGVKGDKGDTGNPGSQGAQGPKGDTVTATDYTLYNVQGSDSQGAMSQDATTKAISAQTGYYTCGTAAGTPEKVVTVESGNLYKRTPGGHFKVKMTNKNTAASGVTLQIGSETAAALWYNGAAASESNTWEAGETIAVYYDPSVNNNTGAYFASNAQGGGVKTVEKSLLKSSAYIDTEKALANILRKINEEIIQNKENINKRMGVDEELVIAAALVDLYNNGTGSSSSIVKGEVTINNSDYISILGASFSDGCTPIKGKDWTNILSELTDYNYYNIAKAGTNPVDWLPTRVRNGLVKGKYAMITAWNINQLSTNGACQAAELMCDSLESLGIEPIICSPYDGGSANNSFLRDFAKRRNYYYFPCGEYYALTYKGRNHSGDNGRHLGTYSIGVWSNSYMLQAPYIDRPMQSLKIFKLREASYNKTLDELVFHTNEERLVNFKELSFGQYGIINQYANLPSVTFSNAVLISAVLPIESPNLISVALNLTTNDDVSVYVLNSTAEPYPKVKTYARFSVAEEIIVPTAGDEYSVNGVTYTVISVVMGENDMFCTIYCSPTVSETGGQGVLEKVSGSGQQSIPYTLLEQAGFDYEGIVNNDNDGHWEEVSGNNGIYSVYNFAGIVHIDKLHFLVIHNGDFNVNDIRISYEGNLIKKPKKGYHIEFDSNEYYDTEELLNEPTFGSVGTILNHWTDSDNNNVVSSSGYVSNYIFDSSIVLLSQTSMKQVISNVTAGKYYLEIMARNPQENVTLDSYDFAELNIEIGTKDNGASSPIDSYKLWTIKKKVGLYPTIIRIPIEIGEVRNIQIKLYSEENIEIFKVSFKKV